MSQHWRKWHGTNWLQLIVGAGILLSFCISGWFLYHLAILLKAAIIYLGK